MDLEKFRDKTASYVVDRNGLTTFLKDIELSDYSCLSDIYALRGYSGLGFKYDEELRFAVSSDLYYYPTMNLSYPKQAADYLNVNGVIGGSTSGALSVLKSIFNERNLFVLDVDDPKKIADKIGRVAVPVLLNEVEDARAYEDWLSVDEATGLAPADEYDASDPRAF